MEHLVHLCKFWTIGHLVSIQTTWKEFEPTWLNPHNRNFYVMDSFFLFQLFYFCGPFEMAMPPPKHSLVHNHT